LDSPSSKVASGRHLELAPIGSLMPYQAASARAELANSIGLNTSNMMRFIPDSLAAWGVLQAERFGHDFVRA